MAGRSAKARGKLAQKLASSAVLSSLRLLFSFGRGSHMSSLKLSRDRVELRRWERCSAEGRDGRRVVAEVPLWCCCCCLGPGRMGVEWSLELAADAMVLGSQMPDVTLLDSCRVLVSLSRFVIMKS